MKERIRAFLQNGGDFASTALELYAWQRDHCAAYRAFSEDREVSRWQEIPAVPVRLFQDVAFTCFPEADAQVVFRTSGTTAVRRGTHRLRDTDLYDLGARLHAEAVLGPLPERGISLVSHVPESSLAHMVEDFVPRLDCCFDARSGVDPDGVIRAVRAARDEPLFVATTAFALADLEDALEASSTPPFAMGQGSLLMITGGFKGRRSEVDAGTLARRAQATFVGATLVGEYGMTELSSQLWALPFGTPYRPPPWMGVLAVDPWTGLDTAGPGLLRFVDLANHDTVLAIETEDLGVVHADGSVELLGRLEGAPSRGCSLSAEEARASTWPASAREESA